MTDDRLILAVPSKGRLMDQVFDYFAAASMPIKKTGADRGYTGGKLKGVSGVDVLFLQAGEIPAALASGAAHLGVTGQDLLGEKLANADQVLTQIKPLPFGYAKLVIAVPQSWIDVSSMADLEDVALDFISGKDRRMKIATKYIRSTRRFFAKAGIADYHIVESQGATEGAPNSGAADIIVDITSTGATLEANGLKILPDGVMLESWACLAGSRTATWGAGRRHALRQILDMVAGTEAARDAIALRFQGDPLIYAEMADVIEDEYGGTLGSSVKASGNANAFVVYVPERVLYKAMHDLREAGFSDFAASRVDYLFADPNPLYDDFITQLDGGS